jgi:hypothetical protein
MKYQFRDRSVIASNNMESILAGPRVYKHVRPLHRMKCPGRRRPQPQVIGDVLVTIV